MKKILSALMVAASTLAVVGIASASNAATLDDVPGLAIGTIGYNARGNDTWFNRNKEFVDVKNVSDESLSVKDLVIEDAWAHADNSASTCNTYTVGDVTLGAGETLRVYVGRGTAASSGSYHYAYMDSNPACGYHGHFINNLGDRIWIKKNGHAESKSFNFENGYTV